MSIARPILVAVVTAAVSLISLGASGPATSGSTGRAAAAASHDHDERGPRRLVDRSWPRGRAPRPSRPCRPAGRPTSSSSGWPTEPAAARRSTLARRSAFRYQYLAGGVNTGNGWATWNTNGQFVSWYVADSAANHGDPGLPVLHAPPVDAGHRDERVGQDLSNLANSHDDGSPTTSDLRLFFASGRRLDPGRAPCRTGPVGLHRAGDRDRGRCHAGPGLRRQLGRRAPADLPNSAAGFARAIVRLRNLLAPNVILAYHLSVWGTNRDISISNDSDAQVDALAARAAAFYQSLGATFDIAFTDIGDRDADFKKIQSGDGGAAWWDAADFARYARFVAGFVAGAGKRVVVWQIPLGTRRCGPRTTPGATTRTTGWSGSSTTRAGPTWPPGAMPGRSRCCSAAVPGGTTCACDGENDGVTNPAAINGNDRVSINADDDGGYFTERPRPTTRRAR